MYYPFAVALAAVTPDDWASKARSCGLWGMGPLAPYWQISATGLLILRLSLSLRALGAGCSIGRNPSIGLWTKKDTRAIIWVSRP